jgi:hypothetical protein
MSRKRASVAGVRFAMVRILSALLALITVTAFFGQMPMRRVPMILTCRRRPVFDSSARNAVRSVFLAFGPYPPSICGRICRKAKEWSSTLWGGI